MIGWIKLHRQIKDWEWYSDINTFWLFNNLLLTVNFEKSRYKGYDIQAGSRVIGLKALASQTPLTIQQIRTSLKKLQKSGEVTIKTTNKFSIISITKWAEYQEDNKQVTNKQQTSNKQVTTSKEYKEYKEYKEREKSKNITLTAFMSEENTTALPIEWGEWANEKTNWNDKKIDLEWEKFVDYWKENGKKKKNWKLTWYNWIRNNKEWSEQWVMK